MATPRLDMSRPYGTIHPPLDGAFYEQNGSMFDQTGSFLKGPAGAKGAANPAPSMPHSDPVHAAPDDDIDLAAWARKEVNPAFFAVKKAVLERYPEADTTNAKTILATLIAEGVVTEDEAIR